ncbi:MOSC domain-containing protein [Ancylomarina longa]|uniref:MOSC domain-containing protein n=1 Tax=Ancylomarina longa TaxID=2487017 RepID=A0A434AF56_9BACT|nr:MOSC domain-containing protein [Ancylomarina longa]RUT73017.1 MOSC domain-containing protein [Ancylomarina longa]
MKILSTNIGKSVIIDYHGKSVKTGIYKSPTKQGIYLGREDVRNDSVIDRRYHGGEDKACYLYASNHYEFWKQRFPDLDWQFGMFGENLTIADLEEGSIRIGDIYRIGDAKVQVTQPRQPCFKLNYRFNCNTMVKEFIAAELPGIYIRVLEEGFVKAGDPIVLLERNEASLTVRDIYKLLYAKEKNPALLERAISDPALADSCRKDLKE